MLFPEAVTFSVCPGLMSAEPSWWRWSRTVIPICGNDSDTGSHSLLLCAFDALGSSAVLGGEYNETFSVGRSGVFEEAW